MKTHRRVKPPNDRHGQVFKIVVNPATVYITLNKLDDGSPIEIFGKCDEGYQGWLDTLCVTASLALQHGCPFETIMQKWRFMRFPPEQLGVGTSIPDAIARRLSQTTTEVGDNTQETAT